LAAPNVERDLDMLVDLVAVDERSLVLYLNKCM